MMALSSNIACRQQCRHAELPLNGKLILFRVRQHISVVERRRGYDWQKVCPVDRSVRRRKRNRETRAFDVAGAAIHERGYELGRHRAAVKGAKGSVPDFIEIGGAFKCAVELAEPHP